MHIETYIDTVIEEQYRWHKEKRITSTNLHFQLEDKKALRRKTKTRATKIGSKIGGSIYCTVLHCEEKKWQQ